MNAYKIAIEAIEAVNKSEINGREFEERIAPLRDVESVIRCKDCEYSYTEGFVHERLLCEKHPELGDLSEDWFCADCWKA